MAEKIKLQMDPAQKILAKRGLQKGGSVQRFFTHEMRRKTKEKALEGENGIKDAGQITEILSWNL